MTEQPHPFMWIVVVGYWAMAFAILLSYCTRPPMTDGEAHV